jgi:hypothetical protein
MINELREGGTGRELRYRLHSIEQILSGLEHDLAQMIRVSEQNSQRPDTRREGESMTVVIIDPEGDPGFHRPGCFNVHRVDARSERREVPVAEAKRYAEPFGRPLPDDPGHVCPGCKAVQ